MSYRSKDEGFGFNPSESAHHFLVIIPASATDKVLISEHFSQDDTEGKMILNFALGKEDCNLRVILDKHKWEEIADPVKSEFNQRLKKSRIKAGKWQIGKNPLSRLFGKELVLLAWAIEDADPALIPVAIKNWQGLMPEERWWLYTMTNAATGHAVHGRNKGWRKAVRYALTENPVSDYSPAHRIDLFKDFDTEREQPIKKPPPVHKKKLTKKKNNNSVLSLLD
jgi:hypothetical protein